VIDVHVALCARERHHALVTTDIDDLARIDPDLSLIHARPSNRIADPLANVWCSTACTECYTQVMPTTRPRHFVTETDDLAAALDAASARWPELSRAQLLVQLALEGHRAAQRAHQERHRRRLAALRTHSGALTGTYQPNYLRRLREDWPE